MGQLMKKMLLIFISILFLNNAMVAVYAEESDGVGETLNEEFNYTDKAVPPGWVVDGSALWNGCSYETINNSMKFVHTGQKGLSLTMQKDLTKSWTNRNILVSYDIKIKSPAQTSYAFPVICENKGNMSRGTTRIMFTGNKFTFSEYSYEKQKVEQIDIPIKIEANTTYSFGFDINLQEHKQSMYIYTDTGIYYELLDRNFYTPDVSSVSGFHFVIVSEDNNQAVYYMDNLKVREKNVETYTEFKNLFFEDLQVKVDDLKDIKYVMDKKDILLYVNSPYAITKKRRVLIDENNNEVTPIIVENTTMIPLRFIAENLGARVGYEESEKKVTIVYKNKQIELFVNNKDFYCNGEKNSLSVAPMITEGRTLIPLRSVAEALDCDVTWDPSGLIGILADQENTQPKIENIKARIISTFGVFVSPEGNDGGAGTKASPLKTIDAAKKFIKKLKSTKGIPEGGIIVYLRGGIYFVNETISFDKNDSGSAETPILYRSYRDEKVEISAGLSLSSADFRKITDEDIISRIHPNAKGKVVEIDLKKKNIQGIESPRWTRSGATGENRETGNPTLYVNNTRQTLSRWPNGTYTKTGTITVPGSWEGSAFKCLEDAPIERWTKAEDPWIYGSLKWGWSDECVPVKIKQDSREIIVQRRIYDGMESNKYYYFMNLLEEIDTPGEYYIDTKALKLYYYPLPDIDYGTADIRLAGGMKDNLLKLEGTQFVNFFGISFGEGVRYGIDIENSKQIRFTDCDVKNFGSYAVYINKSEYITIDNCDFYSLDRGGIKIENTGDDETLRPAGILIDNCYFASWDCEVKLAYAVYVGKIGTTLRNSEFSGSKHQVLAVQGNENLIENCEIYDACKESDDSGAIYSGRSWRIRGTTLRNNCFHSNYGKANSHSIYWDDGEIGHYHYNNLFYDLRDSRSIKGGAEEAVFDGNIFIGGLGGIFSLTSPTLINDANALHGSALINSLNGVPVDNPWWSSKYPNLQYKAKSELQGISLTTISNNTAINGKLYDVPEEYEQNNWYQDDVFKNTVYNNNQYSDVEEISTGLDLDFDKLKTFLAENNIKSPDFDKMGIQVNSVRKEYPKIKEFSLLYPVNGQRNVQTKNMSFVWQRPVGSVVAKISIAKDEQFNDIVFEKEVICENGLIPNIEFEYGNTTYYWKVESFGRSKNHPEVKQCSKIFSFTTASEESLDYTKYDDAVARARNIMEETGVGDKAGQVTQADCDVLNSILADSEKEIRGDMFVNSNKIDETVQKIEDAIWEFKKKRKIGNVDLLSACPVSSANWVGPDPNYIIRKNDTLTLLPTSQGDFGVVFGYKEVLPNYPIWTFKGTFNVDSTPTGWQAISLRASGANSIAWSGGYSYIIIVKPDVIELQRFGGKDKLYLTVENTFIENGKEYLIEVGAVDVEDGVNVIMKVDGQTVWDYVDKTSPLEVEGFISFVAPKGKALIIGHSE